MKNMIYLVWHAGNDHIEYVRAIFILQDDAHVYVGSDENMVVEAVPTESLHEYI